MHRLFYDASCALCRAAIEHVKARDAGPIFLYAGLDSPLVPPEYRNGDTVVLLEETSEGDRLWVRARAIFRIYWLLGGGYRLLGWLSYLPGWLLDPIYSMVARHRHTLQ